MKLYSFYTLTVTVAGHPMINTFLIYTNIAPSPLHSLCWAAAGMGETNYGIKDLLRPFLGNHRSVFACGDVGIQVRVLEDGGRRQSRLGSKES